MRSDVTPIVPMNPVSMGCPMIGRTVRQSHMARQRGHHGYLGVDTVGFLQSVNRLERRFGEDLAREAMREACAHPERRDPLDHRLFVLADDVYGCGGWTTTICAAASSLMGDLITESSAVHEGNGVRVRKYGMTVWLYDLVNDASKALFVGEPSDRTPLLIHPVPAQELAKRCARNGRRRYGNKREQKVGHA